MKALQSQAKFRRKRFPCNILQQGSTMYNIWQKIKIVSFRRQVISVSDENQFIRRTYQNLTIIKMYEIMADTSTRKNRITQLLSSLKTGKKSVGSRRHQEFYQQTVCMEGHFEKWEFCLKFTLIFIYVYVHLPVWVYTVWGVIYHVWGCIPCVGVYTMCVDAYHVWGCISWVGLYIMSVGIYHVCGCIPYVGLYIMRGGVYHVCGCPQLRMSNPLNCRWLWSAQLGGCRSQEVHISRNELKLDIRRTSSN